MTSNYKPHTDPFTDRPGDGSNTGFPDFPLSPQFPSPGTQTRKDDDLVSTMQSDYVSRRMSTRTTKSSSGVTTGKGAAAEYYDAHTDNGKQDKLGFVDEEAEEPDHYRYTSTSDFKAGHLDDAQDASLVNNAVAPAGKTGFHDLEYAEPPNTTDRSGYAKGNSLQKFFASGKYPLEQRIEDKKRGIGRQRSPFVVWILTLAMIGVFIYELILNAREQGNPLSFKPVVNPMLGPSSAALINIGARFPPCMKLVTDVPPTMNIACMNNTANPPDRICTIEDLCGFGGFPNNEAPNQWFRFITPIFIHAGIIHLLLNMLAQYTLSAQIEREMGSGGFFITYFAAGIFGNVLGGNFSLVGIPSVGASGAIFGTIAVTWVDLFAHWKYHYRPVRKLVFMIIELLIGIAIGYIPFVDNFAHIGGFIMGLFVGMLFYPVISTTKRHRLITWGLRIAAIPLAIILFVVLTRNFYTLDPYAACSGCRYLSCFPTNSNNHCKGTGLTTFTTNTN